MQPAVWERPAAASDVRGSLCRISGDLCMGKIIAGPCAFAALSPGISCSIGLSRGRSVVAPCFFHGMKARVPPASLFQLKLVSLSFSLLFMQQAPSPASTSGSLHARTMLLRSAMMLDHTPLTLFITEEAALASANHRGHALLCSSVCRSPLMCLGV
jgi:hypothetical protein